MLNVFGRDYEEIGSPDKGLILKGKIKIQWGKKFIDLLDSDGNINCKIKSFINKVSSESDIKQDGFYFCDGTLFAKVGSETLKLTSESGNTYVSFMLKQEPTADLKYTALQNIGFIYKDKDEANIYPTEGIIYITETKSLYIINNGTLTKYTAPIPNPLTEQLVIYKQDRLDGALIIKGEGILNGLLFDYIKIYSKDNYLFFEFDKGVIFLDGEKKGLEITPHGVKTEGIQSFQANTESGYRIYYNEGKYILEIDKIYVREPDWEVEDSIRYILPTRYYRKENVILRTAREYDENDDSVVTKYIFTLKYVLYGEMYYQSELCRVYIDNPDLKRIDTAEFVITGITTDENGYQLLECFNPQFNLKKCPTGQNINTVDITNSYCCIVFAIDDIGENELSVLGGSIKDYPENNSQLMVGRLDFSSGNSLDYNNYLYGIVSKKTVMYSAKFMKDPSANDYKAFPFYSDTLYHYIDDVSKYGGGSNDWDNVLVPLGVVKKMIPTYSVTGLQTMLASLNADNPSPYEGAYLHFVNGHYVWDTYSLALGPLLTDLNNASYTQYPLQDGFLFFDHRNGTFKWIDITNSEAGLLGQLLTDLNDLTKTLQVPGNDKYLHYNGNSYDWVSLPDMNDYQNLMDTIVLSNIDDELMVSPDTITIKAAETYAGVVDVTCGTKWVIHSLSNGMSLSTSSRAGNGTIGVTLSSLNMTTGNKTYYIIVRDMYYGRVQYLDYSKASKHEKRITITLLAKKSLSWLVPNISANLTNVSIVVNTSYNIISTDFSNTSWITSVNFNNSAVDVQEYATIYITVSLNTTGFNRNGYFRISTQDGVNATINITQNAN